MKLHRHSRSTARLGLSLTACLALGASAEAQLDPTVLSLSQPAYEVGETAQLTLEAQPFHLPILILGRSQGPTVIPGFATFGVGLNPLPRLLFLQPLPASGQKTYTCGFICESGLRERPYYIEALTIDPFTSQFAGHSNTVVLQQVDGDCGACVEEADADASALYGGGHALWLPGIGTDFVMAPGGALVERSDGTARLMGVVSSLGDPSKSFAIDVLLYDRVDPFTPDHPPAGSPKLELDPSAYVDGGGLVDPRDWRYYESFSGFLTGLGCYEGALVEVSRRGPAFQVGPGASGKNIGWGGSGWIDYTTLAQPIVCDDFPLTGKGDFNLDTHGDCVDCTEEAGDHAITMPVLGRDFLFVSGGEFEQFPDGSARLAGVVQNDDDPLNRWSVEILFDDRVNPGSASYPPAGSPKKELPSSSYAENGGVVDPGTWHYYLSFGGVLVGLDDNLGDTVILSRRGPAMQVGLGASGKNQLYGASGWLDVEHYAAGSQQPSLSTGDINIDIGGVCDEVQ